MIDLSSTNFALTMLNLWIGLCMGTKGIDMSLHDLGYRVKSIEQKFTSSANEIVKPDMIIGSVDSGHTLLMDWKGGKNIDEDQHRRYLQITKNDLTDRAFLPEEISKKYDVVYIGKAKHKNRLVKAIKALKAENPLLLVSNEGISLGLNKFKVRELNEIFVPKMDIDFSVIPMSYIPFDHNSTLQAVARAIIQYIVKYMADGESLIVLDQICSDAVPKWPIMDATYKKEIMKKVEEVLNLAAKYEFNSYIRRRSKRAKEFSKTEAWDIIKDANSVPADKRSTEFRKIKRLQRDFILGLEKDTRQMELSWDK